MARKFLSESLGKVVTLSSFFSNLGMFHYVRRRYAPGCLVVWTTDLVASKFDITRIRKGECSEHGEVPRVWHSCKIIYIKKSTCYIETLPFDIITY